MVFSPLSQIRRPTAIESAGLLNLSRFRSTCLFERANSEKVAAIALADFSQCAWIQPVRGLETLVRRLCRINPSPIFLSTRIAVSWLPGCGPLTAFIPTTRVYTSGPRELSARRCLLNQADSSSFHSLFYVTRVRAAEVLIITITTEPWMRWSDEVVRMKILSHYRGTAGWAYDWSRFGTKIEGGYTGVNIFI
jgi:hypothetical protein